MTARYGRNKRRAARARIAQLEEHMGELQTRAVLAERRALAAELREQFAGEAALNKWLVDTGRIDAATRRLIASVVEDIGPEFENAARDVAKAMMQHSRRSPLSFNMMHDRQSETVPVLRFRIESDWKMAVY